MILAQQVLIACAVVIAREIDEIFTQSVGSSYMQHLYNTAWFQR